MAGVNVPQFGDWESNGDVPYTEYFDKARKGKGDNKQSLARPKALDEHQPLGTPPNYGERAPKYVSDSSIQGRDRTGAGDHQRRTTRPVGGSERSVENFHGNSPLHVKATEKPGSASPYRSQGFGSSTPGRSKPRQQEEVREKSTAVPKFGEWDEQDPSAGDNYTAVFGRLKNERHDPEKPFDTNQPVPTSTAGTGNSNSGCSCFSWLKR